MSKLSVSIAVIFLLLSQFSPLDAQQRARISPHVADDLMQYRQWTPRLRDLGECEVKHGVRIGIANLYDDEVGNAQLPKKLQAVKRHRTHVRWAKVALALLVLAAIVAAFVFLLRRPTRSAMSSSSTLSVTPNCSSPSKATSCKN